MHERDDACGHTRLGEQAGDGTARPRRFLRRFQYDGVAGSKSGGRHPEPECEGKVEGRDHAENAVRTKDVRVALVRRELPEGRLESFCRLDLAAVRLDQVDGLLDLGDRLRPHLPHLEADRRRQLELALVDQPLGRAKGCNPLGVRQPPPLTLR